ncbi:MAG: hypothetical protein E7191_07810 [Erysipelotrichaceae bacterium]|nr:hypothetical protein [Erysipelotrichaceae bacterium]
MTTTPSTSGQVSAMAKEIFAIVNERRAEAGKKAYVLDASLCAIADLRAKELVSKFSHTRPSGKNFSTALNEAGYQYTSASENIAYGYSSAVSVMEKWMSSSAHRGNILDSQNIGYSKIGIGYYSSNGTKYYVQIFVK